jgi:hypothetical protein
LAFASTRAILTLKRTGVPEPEWPASFLHLVRDDLDVSDTEWSLVKYSSWLKANLNSEPAQVSPSWIEPVSENHANKLHKIAVDIDLVREKKILAAANELTETKKKILIIYGSSHFFKESDAYLHAFGKPQIECFEGIVKDH